MQVRCRLKTALYQPLCLCRHTKKHWLKRLAEIRLFQIRLPGQWYDGDYHLNTARNYSTRPIPDCNNHTKQDSTPVKPGNSE